MPDIFGGAEVLEDPFEGAPVVDQAIPPRDPIETGPESARVRSRFPIPTVAGGPFAGTEAPDPRGFVAQPTVGMIAEEFGISTEGAPAMARLLANLGIGSGGSEQELAEVRAGLEKGFASPVEVRIGPETGELEFRLKGTERFTLFNRPGPDIGDIAAAGPDIATATVEVAAGLGAAAVASPTGPAGMVAAVATGEVLTAFTAEVVKLNIAQSQGLPIDDEQIWRQAILVSGLTGAGGVVLPLAAKIFRRVTGQLPKAIADLDLPEVLATLERGEAASGDVERLVRERFGQELHLTTGQATRDPVFLEAENTAMRKSTGRLLRDIRLGQDTTVNAILDDIFSATTPRESELAVGRRIKQLAGRTVEGTLARRRQVAKTAGDVADTAQQRFLGLADVPSAAAQAARENIVQARSRALLPFDAEYDEIEAFGEIPIDLATVRSQAREFGDELSGLIFQSVQKDDLPMIREGLEAGVTEIRNLRFGTDGVLEWITTRGSEPVPLRIVQRDLSNLRDTLRRVDKGLSDKQRRIVQGFHNALLAARNQGLAGSDNPNAYWQVMNTENRYRIFKENYDRGVIGNTLSTVEGGQYRLADEQLIPRLLSRSSEMRQFVGVLGDPSNVNGNMAIFQLKRGILGLVEQRLADRPSDTAEAAVLTGFLRQNSESLRGIFTADEMAAFSNLRNLKLAAKSADDTLAEVTKNVNKTLARKVSRYDSNEVVNELLKTEKIDDLKTVRSGLRQADPDLLADFDNAFARRIRDDITTFDRGSNRSVTTLTSLTRFLETGRVAQAREVFGDQYVKDLEILTAAMAAVEDTPTVKADDLAKVFRIETGLRGYARFLRVPFPPLSPRGRALTAVTGVAHEAAQRHLADALADPAKLHDLVQLRTTTLSSTKAQALLGATAASVLIDPPESALKGIIGD